MRKVLLAVGVLVAAAQPAYASQPIVPAQLETPPLFDDEAGGNADADDPAIWADRIAPIAALSWPWPRRAGCTRTAVDEQRTVYGLAAWSDPFGQSAYVVVSRRKTTRVALLKVEKRGSKYGYSVVRTLDLPGQFTLPNGTKWSPCDEPGVSPQVEGMVVDWRTGTLYAGQEDVGIWRLSARLTGNPVLVDKVREFGVPGTYDPSTEECVPGRDPGFGGRHISADVEGLTIHYGQNLLLASSQGDNTFAAYRLPGVYKGSFHIGDGRTDSVEESDGAAVSGAYLGPRFPNGLLAVQDGHNAGEPRDSTNFKFVRWDDVVHTIR